VAERSGQGRKSEPEAVLRFSLVVVHSFPQVFSPARVVTWCALEVPWGTPDPGQDESTMRFP